MYHFCHPPQPPVFFWSSPLLPLAIAPHIPLVNVAPQLGMSTGSVPSADLVLNWADLCVRLNINQQSTQRLAGKFIPTSHRCPPTSRAHDLAATTAAHHSVTGQCPVPTDLQSLPLGCHYCRPPANLRSPPLSRHYCRTSLDHQPISSAHIPPEPITRPPLLPHTSQPSEPTTLNASPLVHQYQRSLPPTTTATVNYL